MIELRRLLIEYKLYLSDSEYDKWKDVLTDMLKDILQQIDNY
jgi:hypothetical protein